MKRFCFIIFFIYLTVFTLYSSGMDFSIGGSYRFGYHLSYNNFDGFIQMVTIPVSISFYPGGDKNKYFSLGLRNKFGYCFTFYKDTISGGDNTYEYNIYYDTYPMSHEVYNNLSLILKAGGQNAKFVFGAGCGLKYTFVNIPEGYFEIHASYYPDINFYIVESGDYDYFSIGPAFDFGFQAINKSKTFCFDISLPVDIMIPMEYVNQINVKNNSYYIYGEYEENPYVNISIGVEFGFSFYMFRKL